MIFNKLIFKIIAITKFGTLPLGSSISPADALKNIADALLNDETVSIKDKELLKKFEVIQEMSEEDRAMVTRFLELTIRDYKAKKAYS